MRRMWIFALVAGMAGCAGPSSPKAPIQAQPGPPEAFVDLRAYVFNGVYESYGSPEALVQKVTALGGPQGDMETNADYSSRMSALKLYSVTYKVSDYQVEFDKVSGALTFKQRLDDAQEFGYRIAGKILRDYKNSYYSLTLPDTVRKKGEFIGQNSFGAQAVIEKVDLERVYLVGPPIPKASQSMQVDLISRLNISAKEFKEQQKNIRVALIVEPVPDFVQVEKSYGDATILNKKETTMTSYFLVSRFAAASVVNISTGKIISDTVRVRFRTY